MRNWLGHDRAIALFQEALEAGRLHHAWLLGGPKGVGKGGIARDFAKLLLGAVDIAGNDSVANLVDAGTHPDLVILERLAREAKKGEGPTLARNITVDQVRGLSRFLHLAPSMAERRVVLVDSIDDMERGAANALLKNLEEPPSGTVFLLVSHAPGRLLPTIRSRCRFLPFHPLSEDEMRTALANVPAGEVDALIQAAEGSPGRALAMRGLDIPALESALKRISENGDADHAETMRLVRALSGKAAQPRFEAFLEFVPHFIARQARAQRYPAGRATSAWQEAVDAGRGAVTLSLDPASTVFGLCAIVAGLAAEGPRAPR
jgi:DNA polymerase-3 subunit delta'